MDNAELQALQKIAKTLMDDNTTVLNKMVKASRLRLRTSYILCFVSAVFLALMAIYTREFLNIMLTVFYWSWFAVLMADLTRDEKEHQLRLRDLLLQREVRDLQLEEKADAQWN